MAARYLSEEVRSAIMTDYKAAMPVLQISEKYGVDRGYPGWLARKLGVPTRPASRPPKHTRSPPQAFTAREKMIEDKSLRDRQTHNAKCCLKELSALYNHHSYRLKTDEACEEVVRILTQGRVAA